MSLIIVFCLDTEEIQRISNHPVHIIDSAGEISPSSFIPFCQFGVDMNLSGGKRDNFSLPVCKIFKEKIFRDQLCYQVDLDEIYQQIDLSKRSSALSQGLTFLMDYNTERNTMAENVKKRKITKADLNHIFENLNKADEATIHIELLAPKTLYGAGNYGLTNVKQIDVTKNFLNLPTDIQLCQNDQSFEDCLTRYFKETIIRMCDCTPYQLRDYQTSQVMNIELMYFIIVIFLAATL